MDKEELDKYKIRDYYMIPIEIVDNIFYEFETQLKKQKEVIDKVSSYIKLLGKYDGEKCTRGFSMMTADLNKLLDILKEVE